jgi:hypothetical protein
MRKSRLAIATAVAPAVLATVFCTAPGPAPAQSVFPNAFVVSDVRLFDGEQVTEHRNLLVSGGRILQVGGVDLLPPDAEVINGSGRTLLPGFIDSHVHLPAEPERRRSPTASTQSRTRPLRVGRSKFLPAYANRC